MGAKFSVCCPDVDPERSSPRGRRMRSLTARPGANVALLLSTLYANALAERAAREAAETCRRCTECVGEEHHWLTSMPECPEDGEPFIPCKHCDARAAVCDECFEAPVWPIMSNQPLCASCRLEGES